MSELEEDEESDNLPSSDEMRLLRVASCFSNAAMRLSAELDDELPLAVLLVCPEPVVPQAVTAISRAVAAIGRNMFDAPNL